MRKANLAGASCKYGNLSEATLFHAKMSKIDLHNSILVKTKLNYARLENSNLYGVDFSKSFVKGAIFTDANGLTNEQKKWLKKNGALNVPR